MSLKPFEALLGRRFQNPSLLEEALTHRSFHNKRGRRRSSPAPRSQAAGARPVANRLAHAEEEAKLSSGKARPSAEEPMDNQRLEFLGDAVLSLAAADMLMENHPAAQEGFLTKKRSELVSGESLARIARQIKIHEFLRTDGACDTANPRLLADALEACIGAVYLDAGFEKAKKVAERLFIESQTAPPASPDYKSLFQEWSQKNHQTNPVYKLKGEAGPEHQKTFLMEALLHEKSAGKGRGKTKKAAEQAAALQALKKLNISF